MKITRTNFRGKTSTLDLDVTKEQINAWIDGELIQNVMPQLSAGEREFIISGILPEDWDEMFGKDEYD